MDLDIEYQYRKSDVEKLSPIAERFKTSDRNQLRQKLEALPEKAQIYISPYSPTKKLVFHKRTLNTVLGWKKSISTYVSEGYTWEDAFKSAFAGSGYLSNNDDEEEIPFIPDDTEYYTVMCVY